MVLTFSDMINDRDRLQARAVFFTHVATLDYHGQDLYSIGQTLLFAACDIISPLQGGLKAQMNEGSEAFIAHMRDKQYHVRDMIEFLDKRLHLTAYVKDNDAMLMRLIQQFEHAVPDKTASLAVPLKRSALAAQHVTLAKNIIKDHSLDRPSVAKAMQDVAVVCLALSGVPARNFHVSLKVQNRHLRKLHRSISQCRYGAQDILNEQERMHKRMGS